MQACDAIHRYYRDLAVVFSGRSGFHIHVLDFNPDDLTRMNYRNRIKSHEVARYRFSKVISLDTYCYDRAHFILSVDPLRVITVPATLNAETGLKCLYLGTRRDLEATTIPELLHRANPLRERFGRYPEPSFVGAVKCCA